MKTLIRNCKVATMYILMNKDKALSISKRLLLAVHLLTCEPCRIFKEQNDLIDKQAKEISKSIENPKYNLKWKS